jgi:sugar lactone lactonase YvrE
MPNGLVFLPNGDAVVSRDLGTGTGMTRIRARNPEHPQFNWAQLDDTNGMAVDPRGRWLYTVETFAPESRVYRIRIGNPSRIEVVASLGEGTVPKGLDDMTIDARGRLYIAASIAGEVIRLNPRTGVSCVIASGLQFPSAVKFGRGPGWSKRSLYVTGFDGAVIRLAPPVP